MALVPTLPGPYLESVDSFPAKKKVAIIGSTGSIGQSALEVIARHRDLFEVVLLVAGANSDLLIQQAREFSPAYLFLADPESRKLACAGLTALKRPQLLDSTEQLHQLLKEEKLDLVLAAVVGFAGLASVVAAVEGGATVALANKESLVSAGALISQLTLKHQVQLIPVDSEHSAIFQAMQGERFSDVSELVLTASGGPFLGYKPEQLCSITPAQALKHPTWNMGAKISIDSASMVNKALELAEAHWLFGIAPEKISVLVHPQSIVHSLVNFCDGSSIAQLGVPDMKVAIAYALNYPAGRLSGIAAALNLEQVAKLDFLPLDQVTFPAPKLMRSCLQQGGVAPAVFTIANDIAVDRFLKGTLTFDRIIATIEGALELFAGEQYNSLSDLLSLRDRIYAESGTLR